MKHVSARLGDQPADYRPESPGDIADFPTPGYDGSSVAELLQAWGIEGQPYQWSIGSCRTAPGELHADVDLPEASMVVLIDAAVHVARMVDGSDPKLMLPASVGSVRCLGALADSRGAIEVHRRRGNDDELIADIVARGTDGTVCVEIRSLRYADVESGAGRLTPVVGGPSSASAEDGDTPVWSTMSAGEILRELEIRLQAVLARELGMPPSAVNMDQPFPELGLDSMMAMTVLRDAKRWVGTDLSATMLWNHPTVSSLAAFLHGNACTTRRPG